MAETHDVKMRIGTRMTLMEILEEEFDLTIVKEHLDHEPQACKHCFRDLVEILAEENDNIENFIGEE